MIGQRIGGYRVTRLLGEGGMGRVFEVVHEAIGRRAAIKVLRPDLCAQDEFVARLFREAQAVNRIGHPGLLSIFDLGYLPGGAAYLIMEYLEGEPLRTRLSRTGRLGTAGLNVLRQVASAMVPVHEAGIVHRDLKPDNIMIIADPEAPGGERAKILDFGIAKIVGPPKGGGAAVPRTRTGAILGTALYMAPEQCRGLPGVDGQADVYALGIMAYEILTGRPPFVSEALGEILIMHLSEPARPLRKIDPTISAGICTLVHAMLAKEPAERPTMAQVVSGLLSVAPAPGGPPLSACSKHRVLAWRRPWWLPSAGVAAGAVVLLVGLLSSRPSRGPVPITAQRSVQQLPASQPPPAAAAVVLPHGHETPSTRLRRRKASPKIEEMFKNEDIYLPRPRFQMGPDRLPPARALRETCGSSEPGC